MDDVATPIIEDRDLKVSEWVLAFVNSMGGTPLIELYVVANELT
jgi:dihydroxyacetone kinase-like protein